MFGMILGATASTVRAQTPTPPEVQQVRLAWVYDSATTMTVRWRGGADDGRAQVRPVGSETWTEVQASELPIGSDAGRHFEVTFIDLAPATQYEYQLAEQSDWTEPYNFRTTSAAGEPVTAAFVADTGIPGRLDGLATGTIDVLRAIDALDPTVVLGGGDYAYFDTDSRYATQSEAMDAWLRSMEPVASERPFMPTYGNHEVLLQEQVTDWIARFATPEGDAGRTSYSFDVDGVHFVALLAHESQISPETFAWLAADLEDAKQRGVRTIVPYLHRNLYGDGTVHDPSPSLARQLTALFELHDIDVVLTAHDQSYERTFPLSQGEPTTNSRRCYTGAEGITWVKTSPGGKLSNISGGFSGYSVTPPSPQVAVRENALHHFSTVTVTGSDLEVVTYGVVGDGSPAVVVDRFQYQEACAPELGFTGQPAILDVDEQSAPTFGVTVSVADPAVAWSADVPWLSVVADSEPGNALVALDAAQLAVGTHVTSVRAELAGYEPATLLVV
ncbi:MAG TPA: metallophosphoesterase family protein, partial [Ilumatobacter sp.]|nr:metallophosphoesterase family protein [Ilumatobacter sp.]